MIVFAIRSNPIKQELYDVISGKSKVRYGKAIQAIAGYLRKSKETGQNTKESKFFKEQEELIFESYINANKLWVENIDFSKYIGEGAEHVAVNQNRITNIF